ncbi:hypothetical protein D3C79_948980 [compost metagenome]
MYAEQQALGLVEAQEGWVRQIADGLNQFGATCLRVMSINRDACTAGVSLACGSGAHIDNLGFVRVGRLHSVLLRS